MSEYDSGIFSGTIKSKYDEVEQLAPGFARFSALAADTVSNYMKKNISSKKAALRLNILRCLDAAGVEWTIGASTGTWYKRAYGADKWEVSSPPTAKSGDALSGDWVKLREITPEDFADTAASYELELLSATDSSQDYSEPYSVTESINEELVHNTAETFTPRNYGQKEANTEGKNKYYTDDEMSGAPKFGDNTYFKSVVANTEESSRRYVTEFDEDQEETNSYVNQTNPKGPLAAPYAQTTDYTGSNSYVDDDGDRYPKSRDVVPEPTKVVFYDPASALEEALAAFKNSNVESAADVQKSVTNIPTRVPIADERTSETNTKDE